MATEIVHVPRTDVVTAEDFMPVLSVPQAVERKAQINEFIDKVLREGEDYGKIPGGQTKPVLLKPGAEKLCSIFGLTPRYVIESETEDWLGELHGGEPFFNYRYRCQLYRGDRFMGEAIGSCNSWESKYRYRNTARKCPKCHGEFIIQGRPEFGGGWLCFKKKGGCGAKFEQGDEAIVSQAVGKTLNPEIADTVNTLQKMAQKRALVSAVLVVTNCSDAFTPDLEDFAEVQQNTPEEQKAVAQKRIAEEKEKTANGVPKELKPFLDAIDKDISHSRPAFDHMFRLLSEVGGEGAKEYDRIADNFQEKYPSGCTDKKALKSCISDLYHAYLKVKAQPKAQEALIPEVVK